MKFMISLPQLEAMKEKYEEAKKLILKSIEEERPILIRHHADCDGFAAGIAMERTLRKLLKAKHDHMYFRYLTRKPMKTPFYDYVDAQMDIDYATSDVRKFNKKPPLIIILDNGGTEGDIMALKRIKTYDCNIIVIDHHYPGEITNGKCAADEYIDININPHLFGFEETLSAGILTAEFVQNITESNYLADIAAISGIGDRVDEEIVKKYLELTKLDLDTAGKIVSLVDYEGFKLRPRDSPVIFEDLFCNSGVQAKMMKNIYPEIERMKENQTEAIKKYLVVKDGEFMVNELDLEIVQRGEYPSAGTVTGMAHDKFEKPRITLGISGTFIVFRAADNNFDTNELISVLKERLPYAKIEGGGHACAGTVKFISPSKEEVLSIVREYCGNRQVS